MTTRITFTLTKLAGGAAAIVAAVLVVALLPASAAAAPTISGVTLNGVSSGYLAVAPAPDGGASEWVTVAPSDPGSIGATQLFAVSTAGAVSAVSVSGDGLPDGDGLGPSLILNDGSLDWIWGNGELASLNSAAVSTNTGKAVSGGVGFVADGSGNIYISDDDGDLNQCVVSSGTPVCADDLVAGDTLSDPELYPGGPDALAYADGSVWAVAQGSSSTAGDLYSVSTSGDFATNPANGPFGSVAVQADPGTAIVGDGDDVYAAGNPGDQPTGTGNDIYEFNAADPSAAPTVYTTGLPADADIQSLAVGADGNIWFVDGGSGAIGELDTSTGAITEYALPSGYEFQPSGNEVAIGPSGSGTLFATAQTSGGDAAVIELSGVTAPSSTSGGTGGTSSPPPVTPPVTPPATTTQKTATVSGTDSKVTITAPLSTKTFAPSATVKFTFAEAAVAKEKATAKFKDVVFTISGSKTKHTYKKAKDTVSLKLKGLKKGTHTVEAVVYFTKTTGTGKYKKTKTITKTLTFKVKVS